MAFTPAPDQLPPPASYLRAGLPRPHTLLHRSSAVGLDEGSAPDAVATTRLDERGEPTSVVWSAPSRYLSRPVRQRWGDLWPRTPIGRSQTGLLRLRQGRPEMPPHETAPAPVTESCRIVTFDRSVFLAGLDPARFGEDDAIFISMALVLDAAVTEFEGHDGIQHGVSFEHWTLTEPVPVDPYVIRVFQEICGGGRPGVRPGETSLDRTDLLCAATAILYDVPLYTTDPALYRRVRLGLRTLRYEPAPSAGART